MNIFSFFNTSRVNPITVDIHSHLLPGIDDGVQTLEQSLQIIKKFKLLGYTKLITTPHIISDFYPNNKKIITEKLLTLREKLKEEQIDISIEAGAEHYVDMNFLELIENDELVTFMDHYVLFETSYTSKPIILEIVIQELLKKGYIPVLAHPERYLYLHHDMEAYKKLKAMGVLFQLNIKSLKHNSKQVTKIAKQLVKLGLVDFIGSDAHRMRDILKVEKILQSNIYKNMLKNNKILNNRAKIK
ncbi:MAG: Unknown protein [uncultured Sulfurovum sp.]|uniref:protein-tyrosine-phosphatase n=1 Tax=uncultured Sulfurovum sp. TaxID=269237 RepID=A0A6S6SGW0_9BACT|nr:MAG: Unknown protein [uncultured Sulfurovum sp.]